jgi:hypothetical protein
MNAPKPLASLSSTLLARKGTARPAMRPQGFGGFGAPPASGAAAQDDLGWNDMGEPEAPIAPVPPVLIEREALQEEFAAPPAPMPAAPQVARETVAPETASAEQIKPTISVATATRIGRETRAKHKGQAKSAFTLRLDADRHLKLRLASALQHRSAQLIVTEALDAFLETLPEVDALLSQLPTRAAR